MMTEEKAGTGIGRMRELEISRQSVATNIKELKDNNVITRIGANKKGYWKIFDIGSCLMPAAAS